MAGADDHTRQAGLANQFLAALLGAPVGGAHGKRGPLIEDLAPGIAGDDGGGEDELRPSCGGAGREQPPRPLDVDLVDLPRVPLGGDLGGEVDDAVGSDRFEHPRQAAARTEVARDRSSTRWFGARAAHQRGDLVLAREQLCAHRVPEKTAGSGHQCLHENDRIHGHEPPGANSALTSS